MNAIEKLKLKIEADCPQAACTLDPGEQPGAAWFLDCRRGDQQVTVEWRPRHGFGLSTHHDPGMDGPEEILPNIDAALGRTLALLHGGQTGTLRALRESRSMTQGELAARLGISQPALSKLERQGDLQLSTLRRLVERLGGTLTVQARFPDGAEARLDLGVGRSHP